MVTLEVNNGQVVEQYDVADIPTIGDMKRKFQDDHRLRFAAEPVIFDPSNNRQCDYSEATKDFNTYAMTCWITQQLDENGEPIKKALFF